MHAYLAAPANRPRWQSSLRAVEDVVGGGGPGTTWTDVTAVGIRPRMRVIHDDPPRSWTEAGEWHGVTAELRLDCEPTARGTTVVATFDIRTPRVLGPLGAVLRRLAPIGIRGDLRRAAKEVATR